MELSVLLLVTLTMVLMVKLSIAESNNAHNYSRQQKINSVFFYLILFLFCGKTSRNIHFDGWLMVSKKQKVLPISETSVAYTIKNGNSIVEISNSNLPSEFSFFLFSVFFLHATLKNEVLVLVTSNLT